MKKKYVFLAFLLMAVCLMQGCSSSKEQKQEEENVDSCRLEICEVFSIGEVGSFLSMPPARPSQLPTPADNEEGLSEWSDPNPYFVYASVNDTAQVAKTISEELTKHHVEGFRLAWTAQPDVHYNYKVQEEGEAVDYGSEAEDWFALYVLRTHNTNGLTLTNDDIEMAFSGENALGAPSVTIHMTPEGAKKFEELTMLYFYRAIAIVLNGRVQTAPIVTGPIHDGKVEISGNFTPEDVNRLVQALNKKPL